MFRASFRPAKHQHVKDEIPGCSGAKTTDEREFRHEVVRIPEKNKRRNI
jgi:hypothetical protein